jgi:hypothetical protein
MLVGANSVACRKEARGHHNGFTSPALVNTVYGRWWHPKDERAGGNLVPGRALPWTRARLEIAAECAAHIDSKDLIGSSFAALSPTNG